MQSVVAYSSTRLFSAQVHPSPGCARPPAKGIHISQSEFWANCARNIATFVEIERFWAGGCDQKYPTMLLRRILACNAERQWTSLSFFMWGKSGKLRRDVLYSVGLCRNCRRKAAAK